MSQQPDLVMQWKALGPQCQVSILRETEKAWLVRANVPNKGPMESWLPKSKTTHAQFHVNWMGQLGQLIVDQTYLGWAKANFKYPRQQRPAFNANQPTLQQFVAPTPAPAPAPVQQYQAPAPVPAPAAPQYQTPVAPTPQSQDLSQMAEGGLRQIRDAGKDHPLYWQAGDEMQRRREMRIQALHDETMASNRKLCDMLNALGVCLNANTIALNGQAPTVPAFQTQITSQPQVADNAPNGQVVPISPQETAARAQTMNAAPQNNETW